MTITLNKAGKKFYREWIFRNLNLTLEAGSKWVLLGPNGSGKSTLLQILSGAVGLTEGDIKFHSENKEVSIDDVFQSMSISAPYLELIEEFTLEEIIHFHFKFKKAKNGLSEGEVLKLSGLESKKDKVFKFFSSGMKQRIKLTLAILSDTPILLLDEPCSNLDSHVVKWYQEMIAQYAMDRTIIVASNNQQDEFSFCDQRISIDSLR
ncbi:MAG: ATP-binding cassette domain-containing protein [Bacteroidetes bacterium]|nr:ATP-binding cassette domain-containing protein [Bacteroidota bacterium]